MEEKPKYLPTKDIVFKKMFGEFGNEEITKNFINSITNANVKKVTLDHKLDLGVESVEKKKMVADIIVKDSTEKKYILEMQRQSSSGVLKRFFGYMCKIYVSEIKVKEQYDKLKKVTLILIMEEPLQELKNSKDYHTVIELAVKSKLELDFKYIVDIHVIELSKYKKYRKSNGKIDPWVELFVNPYGEEMKNMQRTREEIRAAVELLKRLNADEEVRRIAELEELNEFFRQDEEYCIKMEAKAEGVAQGKTEGIAQGKAEGMKNTKIEIAKNMLKSKMKIEDIMKYTGLSQNEIDKIAKMEEEVQIEQG